ncbi:MAG: ABC transporter substrate-binding protein [Deltaproteobacteria bacterium]|jgi:branched-chain amino acid transport system substrate-binding protein|nr:ABC transporter substrate-binding protein [Deltaproteobacteria bacterium]
MKGVVERISILAVSALLCAAFMGVPPVYGAKPINIGVIGFQSPPPGQSIFDAAALAVDQINAKGGINGRPVKLFAYDDHGKSADAVEAFQRAVYSDHVVAVVGVWISEVALALEPWAARLHVPFIVTGGASTKISALVHDNYNSYKYIFQLTLNSDQMARSIADFLKEDVADKLGYKRAFIASENFDWTKSLDAGYMKYLPKAGIQVVGHIRFAPDTNDYTPIFSTIEKAHPDIVVTGWAHVGVKPTVQWHEQQVPVLLAGVNAQAATSAFWAATSGATEGVISQSEASDAPITPKTIPFVKVFEQKFKISPAYCGYNTYDAVYMLKKAIEAAHSTKSDALVKALEKMSYTGTQGHIEFHGKKSQFTHSIKYGPDFVTGIQAQWQNGKLVTIWPKRAATGTLVVPHFVAQKRSAK